MPVNRWLMIIDVDSEEESYLIDKQRKIILQPGLALFIPLYLPVIMHLAEHCRFYSIQFHADFSNGIDIFSEFRQVMATDAGKWLHNAEKAFETDSALSSALILKSIVADFCQNMLEDSNIDTNAMSKFTDSDYILDNIRSNCSAKTTVNAIAEAHGVSREAFSRAFTARNHITPKQFITRCLLHRAYSMLAQGKKRIKEVAAELEFDNEYYFSRFFKKHTGITPSEIKRRTG
jgi:AraC-like DNA-binding protein